MMDPHKESEAAVDKALGSKLQWIIVFALVVLVLGCVVYVLRAKDPIADVQCSILSIGEDGAVTVDQMIKGGQQVSGPHSGYLHRLGKLSPSDAASLQEFMKQRVELSYCSVAGLDDGSLDVIYWDTKTKSFGNLSEEFLSSSQKSHTR